jgi:hypothetical protein
MQGNAQHTRFKSTQCMHCTNHPDIVDICLALRSISPRAQTLAVVQLRTFRHGRTLGVR